MQNTDLFSPKSFFIHEQAWSLDLLVRRHMVTQRASKNKGIHVDAKGAGKNNRREDCINKGAKLDKVTGYRVRPSVTEWELTTEGNPREVDRPEGKRLRHRRPT